MLLPFQGVTAPTRDTQGVASLALGYVFHWAFSPPLLNPELELMNKINGRLTKRLMERLMERLMNKINGRLMRH